MTPVSHVLPENVVSPPLASVKAQFLTLTGTVVPSPSPTATTAATQSTAFSAPPQYPPPTANQYAWLTNPDAIWVYIVAFCVLACIASCIIGSIGSLCRRKAKKKQNQRGKDEEEGFRKKERDVKRSPDDIPLDDVKTPEEAHVRSGNAVERVRLMRVALGIEREKQKEIQTRKEEGDLRERDEDERLYNMSRLPF